jgi:hypothetical protein
MFPALPPYCKGVLLLLVGFPEKRQIGSEKPRPSRRTSQHLIACLYHAFQQLGQ